MSEQDTAIYCKCMEEVRQRIDLVQSMLTGSVTTGHEAFDIEIMFGQLRKILELIAFASLTSNKEKYSAAHENFSSHWRAKGILEALEQINLDFYPAPLEAPIRQKDQSWHFPRPDDGFLTKEEFITLYDASSEIIHARNPFSTKNPVVQIGYNVEQWVARIQKLLTWHQMHLVDGGKWIVNIPATGQVHVYPAKPI